MTDIKALVDTIIPLAHYQQRNGFSNEFLIDKLTSDNKKLVESELIKKLDEESLDDLVIETLTYLRSNKAIEPLKNKLKTITDNLQIIIIASNLFKITSEEELIGIAVKAFKKIETLPMNYFSNRTSLISSFYYMSIFQNNELNKLITPYFKHSDALISYNAKRYQTKSGTVDNL